MPCRTRATAQTLQHIWISDSLLEEAFTRFLRVSHTAKSCLRHGSNVPGPLEAHRRLAKRVASVTSVASGTAPPPLGNELGGLFGLMLGGLPVEMEKGWRWQPPGTCGPTSALIDDEGRRQKTRGRKEELWDERVTKFLEVPSDPVETSKVAFEALLQDRRDIEMLSKEDVDPLADFLQSSANESSAQLTLRLVQWLQDRALHPEVVLSVSSLVVEKIALVTLSWRELQLILQTLVQWPDISQRVEAVKTIVESLNPQQQKRTLHKTTWLLLEDQRPESLSRIRIWLSTLRSCASLNTQLHGTSKTWMLIYKALSRHCRPSDLAAHFLTLELQDLATVLLRYWVPTFAVAAGTTETPLGQALWHEEKAGDHQMDYGQLRGTYRRQSLGDAEVDWKAMQASFSDHLYNLDKQAEMYGYMRKDPLIELCCLLNKHEIPYTALLADLFKYWQGNVPAGVFKNILDKIAANPAVGLPIPLVVEAVQRAVLSGQITYAFQIFSLVPTLPLMQCFDLPLRLIEGGRTHGEKIMDMLNRRTPEDNVPLDERKYFKNMLTEQHVELVHLVAYTWAKSPHVSCRTAFRRTWECYRFLHDRGAPLSRLLSRALVRAGISRYLKEGKVMSRTQVWYILTIVQKIEGAEVAEKLDRMVYYTWLWRKKNRVPIDVERPANVRQTLLEVKGRRGDDLAASRLRWRMKCWTRDKSGGVVQPWYQRNKEMEATGEDVVMCSLWDLPPVEGMVERTDVDAGEAEEVEVQAEVANGRDKLEEEWLSIFGEVATRRCDEPDSSDKDGTLEQSAEVAYRPFGPVGKADEGAAQEHDNDKLAIAPGGNLIPYPDYASWSDTAEVFETSRGRRDEGDGSPPS